MKGTQLRAARLATVVAVGGVLALSTAPAFADSGISYYNGSGSGRAVNIVVDPSAILNVNLSTVKSIIDSLPLGAGQTLENVAGSTLKNPTAPISLTVDAAEASGVSTNGNVLTDGKAASTSIQIDAAALQSELALLNAMLQNMPAGTVSALQNALAPLIKNDPTGALGTALNTVQTTLATPIADKLGNPTAHVFNGVSANFGQDVNGDILTINQGGLLTPAMTYHLDPFNAKALPAVASATNGVTSLNIAPSILGSINAPTVSGTLQSSLATLQTTLTSVETQLAGKASTVPLVGNQVSSLVGTVGSTVNGATDTVVQIAGNTVDLDKINALINQLADLRNTLATLNGLTMNDILATGPATAVGSLQKAAGTVTATGSSQVVNVDAVKVTNPVLAGLLKTITGMDFTNKALVTVDGIRAAANVALDGKAPAVASADGHLVDVMVLGQKITTDTLLPPGTSCTISIPGKSTCGAIAGLPVQIPDTTNPLLGSLLTLTLTRGAAQIPATNSITQGAAKIVTLEVSVDLNLSQLSAVSKQLPALPISLGNAINGTARLVDVQFGVASAEASLNPAVTCQVACQPRQTPPNTGSNELILGILALALVAGGLGIGAKQFAFGKN